MFQKLLTVFLVFSLLISSSSFAIIPQSPKKPRLVLMPVSVSDEDVRLQGAMENALAEGLQEKYTVFSGDAVKKKGREIFEKENKSVKTKCDETKCMEDIALAFNSELLATASVTKQGDDYFLSISIQNIFDNKVIYTKSLAYENHTAAQVINKFKELVGVQSVVNSTPEIEQKRSTKNTTNSESALWTEVQRSNTINDYNVYLDTYPKGMYVPLAKARIKKINDDESLKIKSVVNIPQVVENTTMQASNTAFNTKSGQIAYLKVCKICHGDGRKAAEMHVKDEWNELFAAGGTKMIEKHLGTKAEAYFRGDGFKERSHDLREYLIENAIN